MGGEAGREGVLGQPYPPEAAAVLPRVPVSATCLALICSAFDLLISGQGPPATGIPLPRPSPREGKGLGSFPCLQAPPCLPLVRATRTTPVLE